MIMENSYLLTYIRRYNNSSIIGTVKINVFGCKNVVFAVWILCLKRNKIIFQQIPLQLHIVDEFF